MYLSGASTQTDICAIKYSCSLFKKIYFNINKSMEVCICVSVVGGGVRAAASGPDCSGVGEEAHAAPFQILGETQHGPYPAESSLLLH